MTIEIIDKWVTSLRFNEIKKMEKRRSFCWFLIDYLFCRMAETAVLGSPSVTWLSRKWRQSGSQCGFHLRLFIECVCVWSPTVLQQTLTTYKQPKHNYARVPEESTRCEAKMGQICTIQTSWLCCSLSHAHLCSEHFADCDFVNFMAEYQMGFASKRNL